MPRHFPTMAAWTDAAGVICVQWYFPFAQVQVEPATASLQAVDSGQPIDSAPWHEVPCSGHVAPTEIGAPHSVCAASLQSGVAQATAAERHAPAQCPIRRPAPWSGWSGKTAEVVSKI
jgi:hypothetical protein